MFWDIESQRFVIAWDYVLLLGVYFIIMAFLYVPGRRGTIIPLSHGLGSVRQGKTQRKNLWKYNKKAKLSNNIIFGFGPL